MGRGAALAARGPCLCCSLATDGVRVCLLARGQVFVGNLPPEAEARDLRDFFRDFGTINDAWVARKPPGFGFVWFDDERDAVLLTPDCFPASSQRPSPLRRCGETTRRALSRASVLRAANRRAPSLPPLPVSTQCGRQGQASVAGMKTQRRKRHTASGIPLCVNLQPGACKPPGASISSRAAASAQARAAARAAETANSSA